ncbi:MAG: class I tRNA ligase family protein [Oscillospiraceae bacterium]
MKELPKVYDPKQVESKIYDMWMRGGYFAGKADPDKKPFSIVMPPPNVTGQLHMGHALDATLQDILTRYKRMQGYAALWVPGTDHAGIATQIKVEEMLRKEEGLTRYDLGRDAFLERVWAWKKRVRRPHRRAAEDARRVLRLGPQPLHHGRRLLEGCA